jgi:hypothetical protein
MQTKGRGKWGDREREKERKGMQRERAIDTDSEREVTCYSGRKTSC